MFNNTSPAVKASIGYQEYHTVPPVVEHKGRKYRGGSNEVPELVYSFLLYLTPDLLSILLRQAIKGNSDNSKASDPNIVEPSKPQECPNILNITASLPFG